jgi:WW domain-containing oxidoreductase
MRGQAKEHTLSASKQFASRYSALLSIFFTAMLGRPGKAADGSRRANSAVTRLYEPHLKKHDVQSRFLEVDAAAIDFETMYRPMPASQNRETHRAIAALDRLAPCEVNAGLASPRAQQRGQVGGKSMKTTNGRNTMRPKSIPCEPRASTSADCVNPFSARSTANHILAGIDLSRKQFVVTDCNSPNGFQTMRALEANGAQIIGLATSITDASTACAQAGVGCIPLACDLSDLGSVAAAAENIRISHAPLDGIIANAEISHLPTLQTRYGVEKQFLGNYLGHFVLLNNLCDIVRDGSGRIVILGSGAGVDQIPPEGVTFANLDGRHSYNGSLFYEQSKFAVALYGKELARRLRARGVAVNSVHPAARVNGHLPSVMGLVRLITDPFLGVEQRVAATQTLLAASPLVARISGESWSDCQIVAAHPLLDDRALAERLWEMSDRVLSGSLLNMVPRASASVLA